MPAWGTLAKDVNMSPMPKFWFPYPACSTYCLRGHFIVGRGGYMSGGRRFCCECKKLYNKRSLEHAPKIPHPTRSAAERFWEKVEKTNYCWLWRGSKNGDGYGTFTFEGRVQGAHRVAWKLAGRTIPDGKELDHIVCDNPACVRVSHMKPATHIENVKRGRGWGGTRYPKEKRLGNKHWKNRKWRGSR